MLYTHPYKQQLDKDDLFIYPDLQILNEEDKINSSRLASLSKQSRTTFIFGDELSGKTTLAQKLQRVYFEVGKIAVYVNACNINSSKPDKLHRLVCRNIKNQYADVTESVLKAIERKRIVLIVDDFHNIKLNKKNAVEVICGFNDLYDHILYFSSTNKELEILATDELTSILAKHDLYRIKELGFKLRDDMIGNWISIGRSDVIDETDKHKQIIETAGIINSTVGRNYVPTYPIYILTLLQSFEASTAKSLQGSAYAEFYNYLITHALGSSGVKAGELDLFYSLLSDLSYKFFSSSEKDINENGLMDFYIGFCERKMIDRKYEKTKSILIRSKILKSENEIYWFNHNYIYYFFVARFLSENSSQDDIKSKILALTKRLYLSEFSNIIMFLVHFSKDQFVLDRILDEARDIFSDTGIATFDKNEFVNINNLVEKELNLVIDDMRPEDARTEELELKDDIADNTPKESNNEVDYKSDIKKLDVFGKINLAFKIIEILGQITKNYYGSLDGEVRSGAKITSLSKVQQLHRDKPLLTDGASITLRIIPAIKEHSRSFAITWHYEIIMIELR